MWRLDELPAGATGTSAVLLASLGESSHVYMVLVIKPVPGPALCFCFENAKAVKQ